MGSVSNGYVKHLKVLYPIELYFYREMLRKDATIHVQREIKKP